MHDEDVLESDQNDLNSAPDDVKTGYDPIAWQVLVGDAILFLASVWRFYDYFQAKLIFMVSITVLLDVATYLVFTRSYLTDFFRRIMPTYKGSEQLPYIDRNLLNTGYMFGGIGLVSASIFFLFGVMGIGAIIFAMAAFTLTDASVYGMFRRSPLLFLYRKFCAALPHQLIDYPTQSTAYLFFSGISCLFVANVVRVTDCSPCVMPWLFLFGSYCLFEGAYLALFGRMFIGVRLP